MSGCLLLATLPSPSPGLCHMIYMILGVSPNYLFRPLFRFCWTTDLFLHRGSIYDDAAEHRPSSQEGELGPGRVCHSLWHDILDH